MRVKRKKKGKKHVAQYENEQFIIERRMTPQVKD